MPTTVTTSQSWFSRLAESIKSVLFGMILFVASFPLLFWNEGRAVRTARSLTEGAGAVVSVAADSVAPGNEGKLVHVSGPVTTDAPVLDDEFGVEAEAVKLVRTVEMYQWKESQTSETRKKLGGGTETVTTYSYDKTWSSDLIDSSSFQESGHQNPDGMPYESTTFVADPVHLGAFQLSPEQIDQLSTAEKLPVTQEAADSLEGLSMVNGAFYHGANPRSPAIGDARIAFTVVKPATVSVVGVQTGDTFAAYQAAAGDSVLLVDEGTHTSAEMFQSAQDENAMLTWILRVVGWFLMFMGLLLVFKPLSVVGDVVPMIGSLLGAGLGVFSFLLASVLSLVTIAMAWVVYRPLLGVSLLLIAGVAFFLLIRRARSKKAAKGSVPLPPLPTG